MRCGPKDFLRNGATLAKLCSQLAGAGLGQDRQGGAGDVIAHPRGEGAQHLLHLLKVDGVLLIVFPLISIDLVGIWRRRGLADFVAEEDLGRAGVALHCLIKQRTDDGDQFLIGYAGAQQRQHAGAVPGMRVAWSTGIADGELAPVGAPFGRLLG